MKNPLRSAAWQEGRVVIGMAAWLVNMLLSVSQAHQGRSSVILLVSPEKGMMWQCGREQHRCLEEHLPF